MSANGRKFRNGNWRCRRGGETFTIVFKKTPKSPFDIPGVKTKATTKDILEAIKDSRERIAEYDAPVKS